LTSEEALGISVGLAYLGLLLAGQYQFGTRRRREDAKAEIALVRDRFRVPSAIDEPDPKPGRRRMDKLLSDAALLLGTERFASFFAFDASPELAAWKFIHRAVVTGVADWLEPGPVSRARVERALGQLDELEPAAREVWKPILEKLATTPASTRLSDGD
jgi:hypothetical protein